MGGDLSLLDPFDSAHSHFGLDAFEIDREADERAGLAPFAPPPGHSNSNSNSNSPLQPAMLAGGEVFQCKEVECFAVNFRE